MLSAQNFASTTQSAPHGTLSAVVEEYDGRLARMAELVINLKNIADKLLGSKPRDASAGQAVPAPQSHVAQLHMRNDAFAHLLADANDEIERIQSAL